MLVLIAIPVLIVVLLVRHLIMRHKLKMDKTDNAELYREIGRLNKQVISLVDEKNRILALKVNAMGGTARIPVCGGFGTCRRCASDRGKCDRKCTDSGRVAVAGGNVKLDASESFAEAAATAVVNAKERVEEAQRSQVHRFPKLTLVDEKYHGYVEPAYDNGISLEEFTEGYRLYAASNLQLYYTPEIVRRFCRRYGIQ